MKPSMAPVALAALVAAGCGPTMHWTRPNTTAQQFATDSYACARQTTRSTFNAFRAAMGAAYDQEVDKDLYRACLNARGYTRTDPNGWEGFRD